MWRLAGCGSVSGALEVDSDLVFSLDDLSAFIFYKRQFCFLIQCSFKGFILYFVIVTYLCTIYMIWIA